MPKSWLCFIALLLPLGFSLLLLHTDFVNTLWYRQDYAAYNALNVLRAQPLFVKFTGNWPWWAFIATVFSYWMVDEDSENIPGQLLLLPIFYLPFAIFGDWIISGGFLLDDLYIYPMIILPVGYAYVIIWVLFMWFLDKLRLVL